LTRYQLIDVSENQLKDLLRSDPALLEDGLKHINHQIFTAGGLLDVLMVDRAQTLVIVKVSDVEDDDVLVQGIDLYDAALNNLDGFARAYSTLKIDCGQNPRLLLISPSFSQAVRNRIKWIKIPISLFTYQSIQIDNAVGEIIPIYKEITSPVIHEKVQEYSFGENYIPISHGDEVLAETIVAKILEWDRERITVKQTDFDISIQISGKVLCYIGPRKTHFIIYTNDSQDRWTKYRVRTREDLDAVLSVLRANYDKMRR
jgi:hypothetical protein